MADLPFLLLPAPAAVGRDKGRRFFKPLALPAPSAQHARIKPVLKRLASLLAGGAALANTPDGADPDQIVVFETAGAVDNFIRAVKHMPGLEWLAEVRGDDIPAENGFADDEGGNLPGHLYLLSENRRGLAQLLRRWKEWRADPNAKFPHGQTPLKQVFAQLHDVRLWGPEDRVRETGIRENWEFQIEQGADPVRFEAELWHREDPQRRRLAEAQFSRAISRAGGRIVRSATIDAIRYHGVLVDLPAKPLREVLATLDNLASLPATSFIRAESVMIFRPAAQLTAGTPTGLPEPDPLSADAPAAAATRGPRSENAEVALLDGLAVTNHPLLSGRVIVDDPDDVAATAQVQALRHGTAMASLILHGGLDAGEQPLSSPIYLRPILRPAASSGEERMADDELAVDLLHRSFVRMFEGEAGQPPAAPRVKVVNLSVGDRAEPFLHRMSAWARLLDWAAWKWNVLVLVSCGNHGDDLLLDRSYTEADRVPPADLSRPLLVRLDAERRHRRLLSPSEAVNVVTVGGTHDDDAVAVPPSRNKDCVPRGFASPHNGFGGGFDRSVKPDVLLPGGRQLMTLVPLDPHASLRPAMSPLAPGHRVASPAAAGGFSTNHHVRGSSAATALGTRRSAQALREVRRLAAGAGGGLLPDDLHPVLIKTLLVHAAAWPEQADLLRQLLPPDATQQELRTLITRFFGHGVVSPDRLLGCTDQRATLLACSRLSPDRAHIYRVPLPTCLSARTDWRRLTLTLAWMTPINPRRQRYRGYRLEFDPPTTALQIARQQVGHHAVRRGTVQHEILEGHKSVVVGSDGQLEFKINCREVAGADGLTQVPYGLAVSLEVKEETELPVYEQVHSRVAVRQAVAATV